MEKQNITLSLPKGILQKVKILAARRNTSVSALLIEVLTETVLSEDGYGAARQGHLRTLSEGTDLGTRGELITDRSDLHAR